MSTATNPKSHAGTAIRAMRTAAGLSLRDLAGASNTSYSHLSQVEGGKRVPSERWQWRVSGALARHMAGGTHRA